MATLSWKSSLRIGRAVGADIQVHWSMLLGFAYLMLAVVRPRSPLALLTGTLAFGMLFAFVLLHEIGHALAARRVGIGTTSIVLWPLGGFANLSRAPARPRDDLLVYGAGPAVNLALAGLFALAQAGLSAALGPDPVAILVESRGLDSLDTALGLAVRLNLILGIANLVPIYPLDGGRIMRALLSTVAGAGRSDLITLAVSLPLAIAALLYGVVTNQGGGWTVTAALLIVGALLINQRTQRAVGTAVAAVTDRAHYHFLRGDYRRAVALYDRQLARDPRRVLALHNRGAAYHRLGDHDRALADYTRALELQPDNYKLRLDRATLFMGRRAPEQALADAEQMVRLRPDLGLSYLMRSIARFSLRKIPDALADADEALRRDPSLIGAHIQRAAAWASLGELGRCLDAAEAGLRVVPDEPHCLTNRANARGARGDRAGALADADRALARAPAFAHHDPNLVALQIARGKHRWGAGDLDGAWADVAPHLTDPQLSALDANWLAAAVCFRRGDVEQARAYFAEALRRSPRDALLHSEGWLLGVVAGHVDFAEATYAWALELGCERWLAAQSLGDAYRVSGRLAQAEGVYRSAMAAAPAEAAPALGLALVALAQGDATRATDLAEDALERSPSDVVRWRAEQIVARAAV